MSPSCKSTTEIQTAHYQKPRCTGNSECLVTDVCANLRTGTNPLLTDPQTHVADVPNCGGNVTVELPGGADDHNYIIYEQSADAMFGCYIAGTSVGDFCGP